MPMPAMVEMQAGSIPIDGQFSVAVSGAGSTDLRVKEAIGRIVPRLARQTGIPILPRAPAELESATLQVVVEGRDHSAPQRLGDNERYSLEAVNGHVRIAADAPLGALRGIETFLQLVQPNAAGTADGFSVPAVRIQDQPRFPWRGLSLDVSRHFIPVDGVKRTLDGMSAVKLNVFHWHLSDDQGFRVEVKRLIPCCKKNLQTGSTTPRRRSARLSCTPEAVAFAWSPSSICRAIRQAGLRPTRNMRAVPVLTTS